MGQRWQWVGLLGLCLALSGQRGLALDVASASAPPPRPTVCPALLEEVVPLLLRDLPGYVNRVAMRSRHRSPMPVGASAQVPVLLEGSSAILASRPEFTPLPVGSSEYSSPEDKNLHQVFFTVLERRYGRNRIVEFQHYHWLFLAETERGWQVALLFSRLGTFPASQQPLTPPRDATQSVTAEAIRLWLRDCRAGAVKR